MLRSFDGGRLFGELWGSAPPRVLALHGWARTHDDFVPAFGPPADPLDVIAPDLPGFGATAAPPEPWGSAQYAACLEPLLAVAGHDGSSGAPGVVIGHSFGGRVAVHLAARRPDLVAALVLSGVPLLPARGGRRRPPLEYRAVRGLRRLHLIGDERLERARQRYGSPDYRDAQGVMRGVLVRLVNERYDEQLAQLRCPVELVWSENDTEAPLAMAEELAARLPGAVLTRCGAVGHFTPLTAPDALRSAVERALVRTTR